MSYHRVHFHRRQSAGPVEDTEMEINFPNGIHIHLHMKPDPEVLARLDDIQDMLGLVLHKEDMIMSAQTDALDQAEAAAAANSSADDAAEQLLVTLSAMVADLKANTTDPATVQRITALATAISSRAAQLGTAVAANTPAANPPTP